MEKRLIPERGQGKYKKRLEHLVVSEVKKYSWKDGDLFKGPEGQPKMLLVAKAGTI